MQTKKYLYKGEMKTIMELSKLPEAKVSYATIKTRIDSGMSIDEAVTKPALTRAQCGRKATKVGGNLNWSVK